MDNQIFRLNKLFKILESFPENRLHWIESVIEILNCKQIFTLRDEKSMSEDWFRSFGDALMIHHAFSNEPFTKDKFEYALVSSARLAGIDADFAPKGNRGHDVVIGTSKLSLKTQADKAIKSEIIWISKYMELGRGVWSDNPEQLQGLVTNFLNHLKQSDRILILRCLNKAPNWSYELIEIPKELLGRCSSGKLRMMQNSRQMPKPGYCDVEGENGLIDFRLYFDGGSERKLQIKSLKKSLCKSIAEWHFKPIDLSEN